MKFPRHLVSMSGKSDFLSSSTCGQTCKRIRGRPSTRSDAKRFAVVTRGLNFNYRGNDRTTRTQKKTFATSHFLKSTAVETRLMAAASHLTHLIWLFKEKYILLVRNWQVVNIQVFNAIVFVLCLRRKFLEISEVIILRGWIVFWAV